MMKTWCVLLTGVMLSCMLTGCGEDAESVAEEDLPYGATMISDNDNGEVQITYDRRFFEAEEIRTLSSYFYALESMDETLLEETTLDLYTDFVVDALYQGMAGMDGLLTQMSGVFAVEEDVPYTIVDVEITAYSTVEDDANTDLENLYNMLGELSGEANYRNRIGSGKFVTYDIITESDGETKTLTDQNLFLIQVDGEYAVCS
ncbi:MAG: hypothetical protein IJ512_07735 [Ruminococcus sp.]|nr:hypothetical protein [Ruminococcus sp.]